MKKTSFILALAALVLGLSSCKQEEDPKYHAPSVFEVNTPALQNQEFVTSSDMTDPATVNLFCTQPDYGYSAICNYSALVSLDPACPVETAIEVPNETPTSAQMAIKTFEIGLAVNKLLGINNPDDYAANEAVKSPLKVYMRGVCEIPGIEGSRIVSSNVVSYNKVLVGYAEKLPGWIFICGDVSDLGNNVTSSFIAPSAGNFDIYKEYLALYEPDDKIGEKLYVGVFNLTKVCAEGVTPATAGPDDCAQFRFFTQLLGWSTEASLGSHTDDFYCKPITDKVEAGYDGEIIDHGLGNWGVAVSDVSPVTIVIDVPGLKIYVKEGNHTVGFDGRIPYFE